MPRAIASRPETPMEARARAAGELARALGKTPRPIARINLATAWSRASAIIEAASGKTIARETKTLDPVEHARRLAELSAPADMRASLALSLGCTPEQLEADKAGARLIGELVHKRLSIVGLRAGEVQEHDVSERLTEFLARFSSPSARARRAGQLAPVEADDGADGA